MLNCVVEPVAQEHCFSSDQTQIDRFTCSHLALTPRPVVSSVKLQKDHFKIVFRAVVRPCPSPAPAAIDRALLSGKHLDFP